LSIALNTRPRTEPATATREVPIATHDVFRRHWAPACEALELRWVPLFETGLPLEREDIADVLAELEAIKRWSEQHPETGAAIGERLDRLIAELRALQDSSDVHEIYIG
jgi:hypothetical protein